MNSRNRLIHLGRGMKAAGLAMGIAMLMLTSDDVGVDASPAMSAAPGGVAWVSGLLLLLASYGVLRHAAPWDVVKRRLRALLLPQRAARTAHRKGDVAYVLLSMLAVAACWFWVVFRESVLN